MKNTKKIISILIIFSLLISLMTINTNITANEPLAPNIMKNIK